MAAQTDIMDTSPETVSLLERMKTELEKSFFDTGTPARDKAALSRQLLIVQAQLARARGDADERKLDRALTTNTTEPLNTADL